MAKNSSIEWTHHTFNPWWGCAKVSPACEHCYAESWAKRVGQRVWGRSSPRRFFSEKHWSEPLRWNQEAMRSGIRHRVFCASMADVFESRAELNAWRSKLWNLVKVTPMLDWLLLTKRPQNIGKMVPWNKNEWPTNVWLGTTAENQFWAGKRVGHLLEYPAVVRFLSCEPLLGKIDLSPWENSENTINWVIAGGESGPGARPMNPAWARTLRDYCLKRNIAFHFKQWGHWAPATRSKDSAGKILEVDGQVMAAVGKMKAGRKLDGNTWDEIPLKLAA